MAVVVRALHHLDHLLVVRLRAVARRVDRQINAMALVPFHVVPVHRVVRLQVVPAQVHRAHPVRIAMVHHQVVAPQVVVTRPIAALIQVVARRVDRQIDAMALVIHQEAIHPVQVRVHLQIVQQVAHTETETHVRQHDQVQIVPIAHLVRMEIAILDRAHVHRVTDQNVVMIAVLQVTVQQAVHTVTAMHGQAHVHLQIVPIVRLVHTVTDLSVAMIVAQVRIVQLVVRTGTAIRAQTHDHRQIEESAVTVHAIPVRAHVQVQIVQRVVHTVTETHVQVQIVPIVHPVRTVTDQNVVMTVVHQAIAQLVAHTEIATRDQVQIVHVAKTHSVAIVHVPVMTAVPVHLHVTANAVADQIVPAVVFPMIAKNVHVVALAKSA